MRLLSAILRWIAYPVEPFGFVFVQDGLPPSLPNGLHNRLGQQQGLFDQLDGGETKMLQYVHGWMDPNAPVEATCSSGGSWQWVYASF